MSVILFLLTLFYITQFDYSPNFVPTEIIEQKIIQENIGDTVDINNKSYLLIKKYMTPNQKFILRLVVEKNFENEDYIKQAVGEDLDELLECFNGQDTFFGNSRGGGPVIITVWRAEDEQLLREEDDLPEELSDIINGCIKVLEISDDLEIVMEKQVGDAAMGRKEVYLLDLSEMKVRKVKND